MRNDVHFNIIYMVLEITTRDGQSSSRRNFTLTFRPSIKVAERSFIKDAIHYIAPRWDGNKPQGSARDEDATEEHYIYI